MPTFDGPQLNRVLDRIQDESRNPNVRLSLAAWSFVALCQMYNVPKERAMKQIEANFDRKTPKRTLILQSGKQ